MAIDLFDQYEVNYKRRATAINFFGMLISIEGEYMQEIIKLIKDAPWTEEDECGTIQEIENIRLMLLENARKKIF